MRRVFFQNEKRILFSINSYNCRSTLFFPIPTKVSERIIYRIYKYLNGNKLVSANQSA